MKRILGRRLSTDLSETGLEVGICWYWRSIRAICAVFNWRSGCEGAQQSWFKDDRPLTMMGSGGLVKRARSRHCRMFMVHLHLECWYSLINHFYFLLILGIKQRFIFFLSGTTRHRFWSCYSFSWAAHLSLRRLNWFDPAVLDAHLFLVLQQV